MFDINRDQDDSVVLVGRLDALSAPVAREFLATVTGGCRVDFRDLEYIASAGLGLLAATQQRLRQKGEALVLVGLSPHLREVLSLAGFESFFDFE